MGVKSDSHLTSRTSLGIGQAYLKDFIIREPLPLPSSVAFTPSTGVGLEGEGTGKEEDIAWISFNTKQNENILRGQESTMNNGHIPILI